MGDLSGYVDDAAGYTDGVASYIYVTRRGALPAWQATWTTWLAMFACPSFPVYAIVNGTCPPIPEDRYDAR
jgi:hypothetical protein